MAGFAESARVPFDLPEADAEIVAGYNTEYGGMRFGSFFMAEYLEMVVIGGVATAMFLGGWHGPGPVALGPLWVLLKIMLFVVLFIWVRATLPRFRYDQLMDLGWKRLIPLSLFWLLVLAAMIDNRRYGFAVFAGGFAAGAMLLRAMQVGRSVASGEAPVAERKLEV